MNPIEVYKPLGLISLVAFWFVVCFMLYKFGRQKGKSISKHVAASRQSYMIMALAQTILMPLLLLFFIMWFSPTFQLPTLFTVCMFVSMTSFVVAAWIPDTTGWKHAVHGFAAYVAAVLLVPANTLLCVASHSSSTARGFASLVLGYQIVSLSLFFSTRKAHAYHLYLQSIYLILFDIAILITAYIR